MRTKVSASHLERRACVYVRQSTTAQVFQHGESTHRQYELTARAVALGWSRESVDVIDEDQGRSGASSDGRSGFTRLVDEVAHGHVGAVLAVEVSRLARSSQDWQRLLALCAVAETVVIDEQTIYDPADKDDKLLLDIKGTMSEAELHWLGLRMIGALRSKARRGELRMQPPTGYIWTDDGLRFDPDEAVQRAIRLLFERFAVEPSAWAVARWAQANGLSFPTRRSYSDGTSEVEWRPLGATRVYHVLNNPAYAGVYAYGRRAARKKLVDGQIRCVRDPGRDPDKWAVRIDNAHPGYISWETYLRNQRRLRENSLNKERATRGAPREGEALLVGLLLCGKCGARMSTHYHRVTASRVEPTYVCDTEKNYRSVCWSVPAKPIDLAVEKLFLETMIPAELEVSLAVERQVGDQSEALARHWRLRIEQSEYEARRAERRYKAVDPDNRVVARTLEREWEQRLCELEQVKKQYDEARQQQHLELTAEDRANIRALARNLPKVWKASTTPQSDRKAMLGLVIEAVSLSPVDLPERTTMIRVAWRSGAVSELRTLRPASGRRTPNTTIARIRDLAAQGMRDAEIAARLNSEDVRTGHEKDWTDYAVQWVRQRNKIPSSATGPTRPPVPDRDTDGRYSLAGAARRFGVSLHVVRGWIERGMLTATRERYASHHDVLWVTLDTNTVRRIKDFLRRTAKRYPRRAPPPAPPQQRLDTETRDKKKSAS